MVINSAIKLAGIISLTKGNTNFGHKWRGGGGGGGKPLGTVMIVS